MEAVRAVHRRSAYERIKAKIAEYEMRARMDPTDTFPLRHLPGLYEELGITRAEMIAAGQMGPDDD